MESHPPLVWLKPQPVVRPLGPTVRVHTQGGAVRPEGNRRGNGGEGHGEFTSHPIEEPTSRPRTPLRRPPLDVLRTVTPVRRSHGARSIPFTVASFRTWRGSQDCAAWDPTFYAAVSKNRPIGAAWGRNSTPL